MFAARRGGMVALAAVVIGIACYSRLTYLTLPFDGDGGMFAYMGKLTLEGGRFGGDLVDNKFPTVGLMTGVFYRVFGNYWPGYVVTQLLMTVVASWVLSRQAAKTFGEYARWPMLLYGIVLMNINSVVIAGFQLETIQAFFACIAAACCLASLSSLDRRDALAGGLAAGCAALVKPTGAGVLGAFVIAICFVFFLTNLQLSRKRQMGALLLSGAVGFMFPVLVAVLYLHESDQLRLMPSIARQIAEYAAQSSFAWDDLMRPAILLALFGVALLIRGWVYRRPVHRETCVAPIHAWLFVIAWLAIELTGILMQRRMYAYHFLPLCAPAALLFAAIPRRATIAQLAGPLALPVIFSVWGAADTLRVATDQPPNWPAVASWLDQHTLPGERIWRDNTPQILLNTDLRSASRMQLSFVFQNSNRAPAHFSDMLIDDWRHTRPRYIVLPADLPEYIERHCKYVNELARIPARQASFRSAWHAMTTFVSERYEAVADVGDERVWQIKGRK